MLVCSTLIPCLLLVTTQGNYLLGAALKHKSQLTCAAKHLIRALEGARQKGDSIKDEIWVSMLLFPSLFPEQCLVSVLARNSACSDFLDASLHVLTEKQAANTLLLCPSLPSGGARCL